MTKTQIDKPLHQCAVYMLKQVFNKNELSKVITSSDVWQWNLLSRYGNVENAIDHTINHWKSNNLTLNSLKKRLVNGKSIFTPDTMEDAFSIKLLDRFIRRIYKVRQSDRNKIIRQLITLLKDSGSYYIFKMDIKNCYESIDLQKIIRKLEDDLIVTPDGIKLLNDISNDLINNHSMHGLPRGLSISPTLAEIYLENLDKKIAGHPNVIYSARY